MIFVDKASAWDKIADKNVRIAILENALRTIIEMNDEAAKAGEKQGVRLNMTACAINALKKAKAAQSREAQATLSETNRNRDDTAGHTGQ